MIKYLIVATAFLFAGNMSLEAQTPDTKKKSTTDSTFQKKKDENMKNHPQKGINRADSVNRSKDPNRQYNPNTTEPNRTYDPNRSADPNRNTNTPQPSQPNPNAPAPPGNPTPTPKE